MAVGVVSLDNLAGLGGRLAGANIGHAVYSGQTVAAIPTVAETTAGRGGHLGAKQGDKDAIASVKRNGGSIYNKMRHSAQFVVTTLVVVRNNSFSRLWQMITCGRRLHNSAIPIPHLKYG
jgi:hypothetical protein